MVNELKALENGDKTYPRQNYLSCLAISKAKLASICYVKKLAFNLRKHPSRKIKIQT